MATPQTTSPAAAMRRVQDGARVVAATSGCGTPRTLLRALAERVARVEGVELLSGLLLDYDFLEAVDREELRYTTWLPQPPVRQAVRSGRAGYLPTRASDVPRLVRELGPQVALARVTPPDLHGFCSFGPSASCARAGVQAAAVSVAEVDPTLPRTSGDNDVHVSEFDVLVEAEEAACEYLGREPSALSRRIAAGVVALVPPKAVVQLGIGEVTEAVFSGLASAGLSGLRLVGMATDGVVDMFAAGTLDPSAFVPHPAVMSVEVMGSADLMRFCDGNPAVGLYPADGRMSPAALSELERFVSVNSALQIDLSGQAAAEAVGRKVVSGVGGSADFAEAARASADGCRVLAMRSTTTDGRSRIVASLEPGTPVSLPHHLVDHVVTEHGTARLAGKTSRQRAEALIAVADPAHRAELEDAAGEGFRRRQT